MSGINHVGIILDGNRRWAKEKGKPPWDGHIEGAKRVEEVIKNSLELKIKNLTLYTFSDKNFGRSKLEIRFLMSLFKKMFKKAQGHEKDWIDKGIRVRFAGKKALFPKDIQKLMTEIEEKTKEGGNLTVNFAMGYGGRLEILNAVRKLVNKGIKEEDIDEKSFSNELYVPESADLIIRTSGENRLSGFLPWQSTYSEFIFLDKYWPDFKKEELVECIETFKSRNRRFGK
ncbi:di-trans,poly-cis-decaprenylcistransferase [Candidatus Woesearchaeota archaeon]|nr:di-trans,poly-cis-decaprenylcistransferase [Candidatus Woesearchaeota archaeon]